jgi:hypothetical protein
MRGIGRVERAFVELNATWRGAGHAGRPIGSFGRRRHIAQADVEPEIS